MKKVEIDSFWLPRAASTLASDIDFGWEAAKLTAYFFFAVVIGAMAVLMWKYRRRSDKDVTSQTDHNTLIEVVWTAIPLAIVVMLFFIGFQGFVKATVVPGDAYEIKATAQKWSWAFTYPNGVTVPGELRVPKDRPVKLLMSSRDVLHSLFIPEFRVKMDVLPGAYTQLWFEATEAGTTTLFCTEYCGTSHSDMLADVIVMEKSEFDAWLEEAAAESEGEPTAEAGEKLFTSLACNTCHSVAGARMIGPPLNGIYGRDVKLADGKTIKSDENYIRESILAPAAKVVEGYAPVMPPFQGMVNDRQLDALMAYMKTLE